jgi:hypothetical protein
VTATPSSESTRTLPPPTQTATAAASPTAGDLIDLASLLRALFAPSPPSRADVNGDLRVTAPDVTALLRLQDPA